MKTGKKWVSTLMVLAGALLVTVGNWGIYRGGTALAQVEVPFSSSEFKCYVINHGDAPAPPNNEVNLRDQFSDADGLVDGVRHVVREPQLLCAPAQKTRIIDGIPAELSTPPAFTEEDAAGPHLKCYSITPSGPPASDTKTLCYQFNNCTLDAAGNLVGDTVKVQTAQLLCTLTCKDQPFTPGVGCPTPPPPPV